MISRSTNLDESQAECEGEEEEQKHGQEEVDGLRKEVAFRMENEGPAKCSIAGKKNNASIGRGGQPWWIEKLVTETVMRQEKEAYMSHAMERTSGAME